MTLKVGPTKYSKGGSLAYGVYANSGLLSISVYDDNSDDPSPLYIATVNLDVRPRPNCVWIKDWSENEGVLQAFVDAGLGKTTGRTQLTGYVTAKELRLDHAVINEAKDSLADQGLDIVNLL